MFIIKRNQVIITALVIMVGVAGYLNYLDNNAVSNEIMLNDEGEIAALVPNDTLPANANEDSEISIAMTKEEAANAKVESKPGDAVFVNNSTDSSYFVQAKLEREQSRAKQKELLDELINNTNLEDGKRAESADEKMQIQKRIEKETAAEAMIESKGFSEVYVRIDDETVDVVVNKDVLSDAEIAQIEDIIKRKTGFASDKIRISTVKK